MSTLIRTTGLVLRSIPHGDTSLIITLYTRDSGKIGIMAKGARAKRKGASAAGLELLCESQFVLYYKATRDLQLVKEWAVERPHLGLRSDFAVFSVANALLELLLRATQENDSHPELYDAASVTLTALDARPQNPLPVLWKFQYELFDILGFALNTASCAESRKSLAPPIAGPMRYRLASGAFLHPAVDHRAQRDGELSADSFAILARLPQMSREFAGKIAANSRVSAELNLFFAQYLSSHLAVSGTLRSLEALTWQF